MMKRSLTSLLLSFSVGLLGVLSLKRRNFHNIDQIDH